MSHLTIVLLIVGAFVLILGMITAVRAYLENRRQETAPFRDYFGPEYDRDLLRQSSWCDDENLYMIAKLALTPSMFAIRAPTSGIQEAAAQPDGIANRIDPGLVYTNLEDGL